MFHFSLQKLCQRAKREVKKKSGSNKCSEWERQGKESDPGEKRERC